MGLEADSLAGHFCDRGQYGARPRDRSRRIDPREALSFGKNAQFWALQKRCCWDI